MQRFRNTLKKVLQLLLISAAMILVAPYVLSSLGFYPASHAEAKPSGVTAPTRIATCGVCSYADSVAIAAPAVVSIKTSKEVSVDQNPLLQDPLFRYFFNDPNGNGGNNNGEWPGPGTGKGDPNEQAPKETLQGLGSGVIVDEKGYVLTNNHVVKDVDSVLVTLADGRTAEAKVIGSDPDTDLAVLKVKLDKLPVVRLGSSQKLRVGDIVLAIGNPFGLDKTVTQGIVSATERTGMDIGILSNLIQTDASINPGNSGGALIDAAGNLVGINTAIYTRSGANQGIGFAIPIDSATEVMHTLIEGKRIIRGYFGVMMSSLTQEVREAADYKTGEGTYVRAVVRNSPAQKAGLLPGDVITKINDVVIKDEKIGLRTTAALTPGKNYPVEIFRKGEYLTFVVTPAERNPEKTKK